MVTRFLRHLLIGTAFVLALAASAATSHVQVSLVSADASVQPGRPITVALRIEHEAHWHTYWMNAGTGYPTTIAWTLPAGWKAGDIQWPAPSALTDHTGTIVGNGYEGETYLVVTLTPPTTPPATNTVTLEATVDWLMCNDVCVPGNASVALTLPVSTVEPMPDALWSAKIAATTANLPRALDSWRAVATRDAKNVTLALTSAKSDRHAPGQLRFFADDNLVAYELPQAVAADGHGGFALTLPLSPDGPADAKGLHGVLTSSTGWLADGSLPGLRVDAPFTATSATIASTQSKAATPGSGPAASVNLLGTLVLAFIGGAILNLMPCVFPVLGIKILGFVNQAGADRRKITLHGLVFAGGVLVSFWALAGMLTVLRAGGSQLGWGFQLQSPAFVFILAALMLVFALSMSGVFEFGLRATSVGSDLQSKTGYTGSFLTGVLATVVATPCSAPFLAPALGAALALSTAASFAIFTTIAIGLSTPYLLLSIFPGAIKILPRPGAWMETFKQAMAFPLYGTVGYLVWVLAGQLSDSGLLNSLLGLTLVAMAAWLYGRYTAPGSKPARVRFAFIGGAILLGLGAALGWPRPTEPTDIVWQKWTPAAVTSAQQAGKIVYVDFTARWCATCQANKRLVFGSSEVKRLFRDRDVVTLEGDWTSHDPAITAELAKFGRSAVPFNLIYNPGKAEPVVLPELLTPAIVLDALHGVSP